jgi:hypothetical protein
MLRSHKDGLARDTIHVDTGPRFEVVEMDETVFRHEIDDTMLLGNLHGNWEVVCGFRWEVYIDGLLDEWRIRSGMINFDDMQLK